MISGDGVACCVTAAGLGLIGWIIQRKADALNSITRVNQLKDLAQLLDAGSKVLPLIVAVSGRIGSDRPINCETSGLKAVVLEQTVKQLYLMKQKRKQTDTRTWVKDSALHQEQKQNDARSSVKDSALHQNDARSSEKDSALHQEQRQTVTRSWVEDSALLLSRRQEADWYLDDGTGRVNVVGARRLVPTVSSAVFEECRTPDDHPGLKMLGIRKVERILPTGTPLRVVGEAVKDAVGSIQIQQPHNGGPFYVSDTTIDKLISDYGIWSRVFTYASVGFAVLGIYLLAEHAIRHIRERRRRGRGRGRE